MGTESNGGFQNIVMTGCTIYDTHLAGIALEIVDGGTMDRVIVSDITMTGVGAPIFIRLGNRARPFKEDMDKPGIGSMRNITISNIEATGANPTGCAIAGLPEREHRERDSQQHPALVRRRRHGRAGVSHRSRRSRQVPRVRACSAGCLPMACTAAMWTD